MTKFENRTNGGPISESPFATHARIESVLFHRNLFVSNGSYPHLRETSQSGHTSGGVGKWRLFTHANPYALTSQYLAFVQGYLAMESKGLNRDLVSSCLSHAYVSFKAVANHQIIDDPLYVEVLHHTMVTKKRTKAFVGRKQLLQKVIRAFQIRPTLSNLQSNQVKRSRR